MNGTGVPRLLLVTPNFENNSLGRTYCLWLLAKELGWDVRVTGVKGTTLWAPLQNTPFAGDCTLPTTSATTDRLTPDEERRMSAAVAAASVVVAVKPLPTSFGVAQRLTEQAGVPLLLDVDDPDLEVRTTWRPALLRAVDTIRSARYRSLLRLRTLAATMPTTVSNPTLQRMYGGTVLPHVRDLPDTSPSYSSTREPVVRFVGSPRGHKGIPELRRAVAALADTGFRLGVTEEAPADASPEETWYGRTTLEEGQRLVATADIIAIPSLANSWAPAQLPVKLIDAMVHGRAIVASDTPPIRWALGGTGLLVEPGNTEQLRAILATLADPGTRRDLGTAARQRAAALFTVERVAPAFAAAVDAVSTPTRSTPHAASAAPTAARGRTRS